MMRPQISPVLFLIIGLMAGTVSPSSLAGTQPQQRAPLGTPLVAAQGAPIAETTSAERYPDSGIADSLRARVQVLQALPAEPKSRDQVIAAKMAPQSPARQAMRSHQLAAGVYHEFSFYDAFSRLFDDRDYDGFHRSFSVTFDADLYSSIPGESVPVYAELYLSRNGGNWIRYFTTETFYISGANELDDYEVITTLARGYPSDHYDVLIDLYEVGYGDIVATISSDDTDGLYGLPLESVEYDTFQETVTVVHAGGVGALSLAALLLVMGLRRREPRG